jgi:hypothetical protein
MAVIFTNPFWQFSDANGEPLSNGYIFTYSAGTTSLKDTYTAENALVVNPNPIPLDAAGRPENQIWIQGSYRFDLYDANDALIKSVDNVTSFTALNETGEPFFQSFSGTGSQTVFTLTESLGTDSKDIMVFINDESGDVGYNIQNPSAYTLSGTSLTFGTAPATGTNNIYVFAPTKLLGAASAAAAAAEAAEAAAVAAKNDAQAAAGTVAITSTTSLAIGTGSKVFTVAAGLSVTAGQWVIITSDADPLVDYMTGQIASYSGTTLTITVATAFGSGTLDDWTIKLSGVQGAIGAAGGIAGGTLTGNIDGDATYKLANMADGTSAQDYVTKAQLDANTPPDASTTVKGIVELATDAETITGTDTVRAVTPASLQAKVASETALGIVEAATTAEMNAGTANKYPDAAKVKAYADSVGYTQPTALGAVGTYGWFSLRAGTLLRGNTISGASIQWSNTNNPSSGDSPSGTWQLMSDDLNVVTTVSGIFLRIT